MTTDRKRLLRRATATAAALAAATFGPLAGSASAYDTYRSGTSVGSHADATAYCQNSPERNLTVAPAMGTSPGWEAGQTVAWRYYVYNVSTGRFVVQENTWRYGYIVTRHVTQNVYGNYIVRTDPTAPLPATRWGLGTGKYRVYIDYAWLTGNTWSYAQSMSTSYTNSYVLLGFWKSYTATTCDVDVVANR